MTISTAHTATGALVVKLDGERTSLGKAVKRAILENRDTHITIDSEHGASCDYSEHVHYSASNFSLEFDCKELSRAVRDFADWR